MVVMHETLIYAVYYAPRGRMRLYKLGREIAERHLLPADWRDVIRLALFLCPTLVMNLRAGAASHTPTSSAIALSVAVMVGSPPVDGDDVMTEFLAAIAPTGVS